MPQLAESWNYYTKRKTCAGCGAGVSLKYGVCSNCYRSSRRKDYQAVRTRGDKKEEFFGVEFEIRGPEQYEHVNKLGKLEIPANFSYDGGGVEVQFFPFGFKFFQKNRRKFQAYFSWLQSRNGSYHPTGTGIHIHISRGSFSHDLHLFRFMKLMYLNAESFRLIGQRTSNWGHFNPASAWGEDPYSRPLPKGQDTVSILEHRARKWFHDFATTESRYTDLGNKRDAINVCHSQTIEIRIFRSTTACTDFMAYIQCCKALVEYCRTRDDWEGFCRYVKGNKKTYPDLIKLMKKKDLFKKESK